MASRKRLRDVALAFTSAAAIGLAGYALAATATVELTSKGPEPTSATVGWGDTVTFHNANAVQMTITSSETGFTSPPIAPDGTYQKVFDGKAGNHPYRVSMPKEGGGTVELRGTVVVKLPARPTLSATPRSVTYGQTTTLQGATALLEQPVTLQQKTTETASGWADVGQVTPNPDGSFTFTTKPVKTTIYRAAQAGAQLVTRTVTVTVAPRITLAVPAHTATVGTRMVVTARVKPAAATTGVLILRSATPGNWHQVAKAKVANDGSAKVAIRVLAGKALLRAVAKPPLLNIGYEAAQSTAVPMLGVNPPTTLVFAVEARRVPKTKAKRVQTAPDRFSTHLLHANPSKVTLVMRNLGTTRHGLRLSGPGVHKKGPVVGRGRTTKITAFLKAGRYSFSCYVPGHKGQGESGTLVVAQR